MTSGADSRTSRSASRLPGRAICVIRLARLTGRPNQSPARERAAPIAMPARSWGKSSPSASAASSRSSAASSSGSGSSEVSIAASPIVLIRRTGASITSLVSASKRTALRASSSGGTSSPSRVKPTRSAKQTAISREPASCPPLRSAALSASLWAIWRRCRVSRFVTSGPSIGESCDGSIGVAPGEVVLAHAGLEHEAQRQRAHRLRGLREPASERAHQVEDLLVGDARRASRRGSCAPTRDRPRYRRPPRAPGIGRPIARRTAIRKSSSASSPRCAISRGGVAGAPTDHALGRQEHQRAGFGRAPQLGQRHAVGGEVAQQRQALGALHALQIRRADPRRRSRSPRELITTEGMGGRRPTARAESQSMIVLGIDPGLANTGYGVVQSTAGRLVALDGGVIETRAGLPVERRLAEIHAAIDALLVEHEPRCDGAGGAVLRSERENGVRGWAGAGRGDARRGTAGSAV